jgi:hypothetical protein
MRQAVRDARLGREYRERSTVSTRHTTVPSTQRAKPTHSRAILHPRITRAAQVLILRIGRSVGVGALSGVLMFMQQVGEVLGAGMLLGAAAGFWWAIGRWD